MQQPRAIFFTLSTRDLLGLLALACALAYLMTQPITRMSWPLLLSAYAGGMLVYWYEFYKRPPVGAAPRPTLFGYLFPRDMWLHRSALNDYGIVLINALIFLGFPALLLSQGFIYLFTFNLFAAADIPRLPDEPNALIIALYGLTAFAIADFLHYVVHRMSHEIPFLWEFHKVHHSAEIMTPVTLHRAHPVDVFLNVCARIAGLGIAAGIFFYLFPNMQGAKAVAAVNATVLLSYYVGANLRHSHIWLPYGRVIEHVLLSPAQHQIHHSTTPRHFNKNYASCFSLWDWLFGSLYVAEKREYVTFGLGGKEQAEYDSLLNLYILPFKKSYAHIKKSVRKRLARNNPTTP